MDDDEFFNWNENDKKWEALDTESDGEVSVEYLGFDPENRRVDPDPQTTVNPDPNDTEPATVPTPSKKKGFPPETIVFESDRTNLIQMMEIRGNNGVTEVSKDVETKYLLTGTTKTHPTNIIQLDNPQLFSEVTKTSISYNITKIADYVRKLHQNGPSPELIISVHTHPSGQTIPSSQDRTNPRALENKLERHFDDFEFLQGIHGLQDRKVSDGNTLREVEQGDGNIWWYGENRRHKVAFFDGDFNPSIEVIVE